MVKKYYYYPDAQGIRRYSYPELFRRQQRICRKGLPVSITFARRGAWWMLVLTPRSGFTHLSPPGQNFQLQKQGWVYHICIANVHEMQEKKDVFPRPTKLRISHTLSSLKERFSSAVDASLMVETFGPSKTVAFLDPRDPTFSGALLGNMVFTRRAVGKHGGPLTVSM